MDKKYIFVTGGVVSGLGKGITAASLGRLLKERGFNVANQKLDPYLNIDPALMNPLQHGEVFVTDDGAETDLDLGHYERFTDENLSTNSSVTSGRVYWEVLEKERNGDYNGGTVQVVPNITNHVKEKITNGTSKDCQIQIVEIGGTVGDMESLPFIEAIRQFSIEVGRQNSMFIHVTLMPRITPSNELKTKPTQHSVKTLLSVGIQPDVIVTRCDLPFEDELRKKIGLFCNVGAEMVIQNYDVETLYEVPLALEKENFADIVCKRLSISDNAPDLSLWRKMVEKLKNPKGRIEVAIVGKYTALRDAYLSVVEALTHGGIDNDCQVDIRWIDSEELNQQNCREQLDGVAGILVPGGFGIRGVEGKIVAAQYARENKIPFLGIGLGMQAALIEFARNVIGYKDADSMEFYPNTSHPVVYCPAERINKEGAGDMRLGKYVTELEEGSKISGIYASKTIAERHRHRWEANCGYRKDFEKKGLIFSGISEDGNFCECIEMRDHPYFLGVVFHPEFKSRPNRPHPLFSSFVKAAQDQKINQ